ncbi:MAG: penicillin-binding protein 2, partial [Armatimonadetes bacterium]|nr:penicillin-binding protein 2 [Armatimonadota bacterium]
VELAPETLGRVRKGMRLAVTQPHGTARAVGGLGVAVAGKTGSAEHRGDRPTHAWFVCFAPYRQPKYAVAVFVWEGGHGGTTAAPIARRMLAAAFGLGPGGRVSAHLPSASD